MKLFTRKAAIISMTLALIATTATCVMAEEEKPTADFTLGAYSQYIWRAYELSQDSVVLQPSMTVGYKGVAINFWGNMDTEYLDSEHGNWNETDFTISYDGSAGKVGYGAGLIYYGLEDGLEDTQEVYATVSVDTLLAPTLTVYYDIANNAGSYYATLGIGHSIPMGSLSLDLGAQAGYMDNEADNYSELHDGQVSVSMSIPVVEYVTVTPELHYVFGLSSDAKDYIKSYSVDKDDDSFLYGGISASFAF